MSKTITNVKGKASEVEIMAKAYAENAINARALGNQLAVKIASLITHGRNFRQAQKALEILAQVPECKPWLARLVNYIDPLCGYVTNYKISDNGRCVIERKPQKWINIEIDKTGIVTISELFDLKARQENKQAGSWKSVAQIMSKRAKEIGACGLFKLSWQKSKEEDTSEAIWKNLQKMLKTCADKQTWQTGKHGKNINDILAFMATCGVGEYKPFTVAENPPKQATRRLDGKPQAATV